MNNKIKALMFVILAIVLVIFGFFIGKDFNKNAPFPIEPVQNGALSETEKEDLYKTLQDIADTGNLTEVVNEIKKNEDLTYDDYELLMWTNIDLGNYEKVLEYGDLAYDYLHQNTEEYRGEDSHTMTDLYLVQAYLYLGDLSNAKKILDTYEEDNREFIFPRAFYKYKSGDYKGVTNFKNTINNAPDYAIGLSLDFLAKSYIKLGEIDRAIDVYENLYSISNKIVNESDDGEILSTYYGYLSSQKLTNLYLEKKDTNKASKYEDEFKKFKSVIDGGKIVNTKTAYFILNRQNDL